MSETLLTVVFPIILGTVAMSLKDVMKRKVMKDGAISPIQCLILIYASATIAYGTIYISFWGFTLPNTLPGMWSAVIYSSSINVLIQFFNMKAASIDKGEVSLTAPLQGMTPGLITGLAAILREFPSRVGLAGISFMSAGSYVLLWEKTPQHWYEYLGPIKKLALLFRLKHLDQAERNKTMVIALSLGSAVLGSFALLFGGLYVRRSLTMQGLILAVMGFTTFLTVSYMIWYIILPDSKPTQKFPHVLQRNTLISGAGMGILWVLHQLAILPTFKLTYISYAGTLKRFSVLTSVILGHSFFHEEDFKKRLWAATLIVIGAMFIATDDLPAKLATKIEFLGF